MLHAKNDLKATSIRRAFTQYFEHDLITAIHTERNTPEVCGENSMTGGDIE